MRPEGGGARGPVGIPIFWPLLVPGELAVGVGVAGGTRGGSRVMRGGGPRLGPEGGGPEKLPACWPCGPPKGLPRGCVGAERTDWLPMRLWADIDIGVDDGPDGGEIRDGDEKLREGPVGGARGASFWWSLRSL